MKQEVEFESEFEKSLHVTAEADAAKADASARAEAKKNAAEEHEHLLDSLRVVHEPGQRFMHAWVLVKAGARGVPEDTFVEVTSGRHYKPPASPYTGIEWVWNHENFWIAMDLPEPHSDARLHPARAVFDFWDPRRWEAVLPKPRPPPPADGVGGDSEVGEGAADTEGEEGAASTPAPGTLRSMTMSRQKSTALRSDGDVAGGTLRDAGAAPPVLSCAVA